MNKELNQIAEDIIRRLDGKVIIHRYDSHSTNSIYLKFDYGVAYSLRISDHDGYKHLKYRFNILKSMSSRASKKESYRHGCKMTFYSPQMITACCNDILKAKRERANMYSSYQSAVLKAQQEAVGRRGFWSDAKLIKNPYKWITAQKRGVFNNGKICTQMDGILP